MCRVCGIIMPPDHPMVYHDEPPLSCLRKERHEGEHLSQNARGVYYLWSFDEEYCGKEGECLCLEEDGLIECTTWCEIPEEEAKKLL